MRNSDEKRIKFINDLDKLMLYAAEQGYIEEDEEGDRDFDWWEEASAEILALIESIDEDYQGMAYED